MVNNRPRFNPVSDGNRVDTSTDSDRPIGPMVAGIRVYSGRRSLFRARSKLFLYRLHTIAISGACFLGGTGFSIYKAIGR